MKPEKSFDWYVNSESRRAAQAAMTPFEITIAVEGESDWEWLCKLVIPNRVRIEYGNNGGKKWVLERVRSSRKDSLNVIGIIDRDFEGLCGERVEEGERGIFDTEVRDSEVLIASSGVLRDALLHCCPPKTKLERQINRVDQIISEALASAALVGGVQLASHRRFGLGKVVPRKAWNRLWTFFVKDSSGRWVFDLEKWLLILKTQFKWTNDEANLLRVETMNVLAEVTKEAEFWMIRLGVETPTNDQISRARHLLLAHGHHLIDFAAMAWFTELDGFRAQDKVRENSSRNLAERSRLLFSVALFKTTDLFSKIEVYCKSNFGTEYAVFRSA